LRNYILYTAFVHIYLPGFPTLNLVKGASTGKLVSLHKKKDEMDCNKYRGINLLSHNRKVYSGIILSRLRRRTDELLAEEQAGFKAGRSTVDQIYTLRQIVEKCTEFNIEMYFCCIDFRKAFNCIWRDGLWTLDRDTEYELSRK